MSNGLLGREPHCDEMRELIEVTAVVREWDTRKSVPTASATPARWADLKPATWRRLVVFCSCAPSLRIATMSPASDRPTAPASRAVGTDSGVPFTHHGSNLDELAHLVAMGLSPQEAIRIATLDSARLLKLDDRVGSLDESKIADLVIIDGNPLDDIAVLRAPENIRRIVLNGRIVLNRDVGRALVGAGFAAMEMS